MKPANFELSPDTEALIRVLYGVNDQISDEDLAKMSGLSMDRMRECDPSARQHLDKKYNILFGRVTNWGFKRIEGFGRTKTALKDLKSVNRKARRSKRRLEATNTADFTQNERHLHAAAGMAVSVIEAQSYMKMNPAPPPEKPKPQQTPLPIVTDLVTRRKLR